MNPFAIIDRITAVLTARPYRRGRKVNRLPFGPNANPSSPMVVTDKLPQDKALTKRGRATTNWGYRG